MRLHPVSKANVEVHVQGSGDKYPKFSGGDIKKATPDPISNSEVKLLGADGTARVASWESRTLPGFFFFLIGKVQGLLVETCCPFSFLSSSWQGLYWDNT